MTTARVKFIKKLISEGALSEAEGLKMIGSDNLLAAINTDEKVAEELDIDEQGQDQKSAWDAYDAMKRGVTAPPSATHKTPASANVDVTGTSFVASAERNDARDALNGIATPQEIDDVLGTLYKNRADALKRINETVEKAPLVYTGQRHPSGLNRHDFKSRLNKREQ